MPGKTQITPFAKMVVIKRQMDNILIYLKMMGFTPRNTKTYSIDLKKDKWFLRLNYSSNSIDLTHEDSNSSTRFHAYVEKPKLTIKHIIQEMDKYDAENT